MGPSLFISCQFPVNVFPFREVNVYIIRLFSIRQAGRRITKLRLLLDYSMKLNLAKS